MSVELELADWRRRVAELYAEVRHADDPAAGHRRWRAGRDALFREHPQSPLPADDPLRASGLPCAPYDAGLRFVLPLIPASDPDARLELDAGDDAGTNLVPVGRVELPDPVGGSLEVWSLQQYGGGLFLPLRDGSSGRVSDGFSSYGGGRYLLDTAKGADLGGDDGHLVVDLNFAYHPSCRYDSRWLCPLAPAGNTVAATVRAGEQMPTA
ncbi:hypothetical protein SAMN04488543_0024 [Friedmanniella luteola]|uniref:DUF1684 domain-containing protein n=1 Tax=Friedmanniella luteola TaxID=546871 RepID=A0A1H1L1E5_9ACTN|nr:DUF1684 domain-containing protein [Friedmanniella luteola]SDR68401.1 hypothetical protein SAMN04488543_0024 [Friedmanniella luteola]